MVHNNPFGKNLLWRAPCFNGRGNGFATQHCVVASVIPIYCSVNDFGSMTPLLRFLSVFHASSGPVELKDIRIMHWLSKLSIFGILTFAWEVMRLSSIYRKDNDSSANRL